MAFMKGDYWRKKCAKYFVILLIFSFFTERMTRAAVHKNNIAFMRKRQHMPNQLRLVAPQKFATNTGAILIREVNPNAINIPPPHRKILNQSQFPLQPSYFPLTSPPKHGSTQLMKKCKGRKNLIDDIGILSLVTAVTASTFGLYTIIVNSMTSNNIGIISGFFSLLIWLPTTLITLFQLNGQTWNLINNFVSGLSFINSMYGFMGVLFGTADVLVSWIGESIGIISFILSVIATFPDWLDSIIEFFYRVGNRRRLEYYVENYGCSVPGIFALDGEPLYDIIQKYLVAETDTKGYGKFNNVQPYISRIK